MTIRKNRLECLSNNKTFQQSLIFAGEDARCFPGSVIYKGGVKLKTVRAEFSTLSLAVLVNSNMSAQHTHSQF